MERETKKIATDVMKGAGEAYQLLCGSVSLIVCLMSSRVGQIVVCFVLFLMYAMSIRHAKILE